MAISFLSIPTNLRVPGVYTEVDNSRASQGPALLPYRGLLIGQKTSAGTVEANTPVRVTSVEQAAALAGRGSMLHLMAKAWFENNRFTEVHILALEDAAAGVAAAGAIALGGAPTAAGTLALYIGGKAVRVGVSSGDATTDIAADLAAAINADADLPVTAEVDGVDTSTVNVTFRHKGEVGNALDLRVNYQDGEALPAGLTATITAMAGGTTNPSLDSAIAALGDEWYQVWAFPYTDATSLTAIEDELADRFGPLRMIDGVAITASNASHGGLGTLGEGRNSPHVSIVATNQSPTPVYEYAAAVAAAVAYYGNIDPARPFQTLELKGVLPPAEVDRFTIQERNLLLFGGIATTTVTAGGRVRIERLITTYKENAAGAADTSYLDLNTLLTLMYLRYDFRTYILNKYPRHKLANDGTRFGAGQAVITPKIGKAEAIAKFRQWENLGLVENITQFKNDLIVERNAQDPNRLDFMLPTDLINQFRVAGVQIGFLLQGTEVAA